MPIPRGVSTGSFGWTFDARNAGERSYAVARAGDDPVGGIMQRRHTYVQERGSRWVGMISVPDVAKAASYAAEQGGRSWSHLKFPARGQVPRPRPIRRARPSG